MEKEGRIFDRDWSKDNGNHVVFRPGRLSPEQLQEGFRYVLREACSGRGIWRRLAAWHRHALPFGSMSLVFHRGVRNHLRRTAELCHGGKSLHT